MNKEEFKIEIGKIQIAYNKIFTQEEKRLWFQEFQNTTKEEFEETKQFLQEIAFAQMHIFKFYLK